MSLTIAERGSDVPLVQTIWSAQSEHEGTFRSVAVSRWELVVTRLQGRTTLTVRGPETRATRATIPPDGEFFGIAFEHGAFMPDLPPPQTFSPRTLRRRCLRATGLTPGQIRQIDRARQATALLQRGVSILDTVDETGFFDQPHLTRALGRFMGQTPGEILRANGFADMSLSYKTREFDERY